MSHNNAITPQRALLNTLTHLGALRIMLALAALALLFSVPDTGTRPVYHGWEMITTLIEPTLVPLVFMILLLDVMMCMVFMVDKRGAERLRLKHIIFIQLLLAATLILVWYPYFRSVL
jgi:hypothetical protein